MFSSFELGLRGVGRSYLGPWFLRRGGGGLGFREFRLQVGLSCRNFRLGFGSCLFLFVSAFGFIVDSRSPAGRDHLRPTRPAQPSASGWHQSVIVHVFIYHEHVILLYSAIYWIYNIYIYTCIYIYIHIQACFYIYIYIYIKDREKERVRAWR